MPDRLSAAKGIALVLGLVGCFVGSVRSDSLAEGAALAEEIRASRPAEPVDVRGVLRIRNADGGRHAVPFRYQIRITEGEWRSIYESEGREGIPGQRLVVLHRASGGNTYLLGEPGEESELRTIEGDRAMLPFAASDFWIADLGLEFLHWPRQRLAEEVRVKMRKGRSCRVLESINPNPGARGYTRVLSWIDRETGRPIIAEAYGADNQLIKEFEIGGVTKVNGVWELKNMEMRDLRTDSRTLLEFQYKERE